MYAPLQVSSSYSLLKNPNTVPDIVETAKAAGYEAVSLADTNVLYGAIEFYSAARKAQIKPIFSLRVEIAGLVNLATTFPVLLTAITQEGYQNLTWISSKKMVNPEEKLTWNDVKGHLTGLAITLPTDSELTQLLISQGTDLQAYWEKLQGILPVAQVFLGLHPRLAQSNQEAIAAFAKQFQAKLVALDRVDYLRSEDAFTREVLLAINANTQIDDLSFLAQQHGQNYLRPADEVRQSYQASPYLQEAYANNEKLVQAAKVVIEFKDVTLPDFPKPAGLTSAQYLRQLSEQGLQSVLPKQADRQVYQERLNRELNIINELGFSDYFLIVWDILNYAHQNKIQTGEGRGSAAGSLVAYCLQITDVDPIAFGLLFERFLNPERVQMPDIDIDWPDNRREEILNYLHDKYGQQNFAQIITFGTLATKQALRDTGRVFGLSTASLGQLSRAVPAGKNGRKVSIDQALQASPKLGDLIRDIPQGDLLLRTAKAIEGLPRNYSTHAAGVVLSQKPLVETLPVQEGSDGRLLTQFEKEPVEALGLLKIDILGLTNLTILAQALYNARKSLPEDFDIKRIPLNDPETIALFARGDTSGVFQFESNGIRLVLKELHPTNFEHIVAVNALYRPGPSQNIQSFVKRRHGQEPVAILDPSISDILAPTYGIIIYQEQVMLVAQQYAGFTLGQADVLRSAMSKKKLDKMESMKQLFLAGAQKKGHDRQAAEKIFSYIDEFANYGFNRSHAVAYSKLAFELAYLKAHYPLAFYAAVLNANLGRSDKIRQYILEAKRKGIQVKGPNLNRSQRFWSIDHGQLSMGLHAIKGLRTDFVTALLEERRANGAFQSLQSFVYRLPEKFRKVDTLKQLVYAGALDNFGYNRAELIANLPDLIEAANFGELILKETKIKQQAEFSLSEKLTQEKEAIGFNLASHPLDAYQELINQEQIPAISDVQAPNSQVKLVGLIDRIKVIRTKKGDNMAFVTLSDQSDQISVTVFPNLYKKVEGLLKAGQVLLVSGKTEERQGISLLAARIQAAQNPPKPAQAKGTWFLRIDEKHDQVGTKKALLAILEGTPGPNPVVIYWEKDKRKQVLEKSYWLGEGDLAPRLSQLIGPDNVVFQEKA